MFATACLALVRLAAWGDQSAQPLRDETITVSADRVEYFSDAAIVQARGGVRVTLPSGATIYGDAFSMDLSLRRFMVAGHVRFRTAGEAYDGAAFAEFLVFKRAYFVPLQPTADRWTFLNDDYAHPEKGRVMPGDAFFLPDLHASRPYVTARSAVVDPNAFIKFVPATIAVLNGPETPPLPSFVYNFSQNPDFGVNALSGATFDAPYDFNGSPTSLDAIHVRYDQTRPVKTFASFEHHSVFEDGGYAVFSVNPATQAQKQWNLLGYVPAGRAAFALFAQLFTVQSGILQPSSASGYADLQFTHALPESSFRVDLTQSYGSLLDGVPPPNHPFVAGLTWAGFDHRIGSAGFGFRLSSGIARAHDAYGVSGTPIADAWSRFAAGTVYSPLYAGPLGTSIDAAFTAQRTWASFPNTLRSDVLSVSAGKPVARKLFAVASAVVGSVAVDDLSGIIASPNGSSGFVPQPLSSNGLPVFGAATIYPRVVDRAYVVETSWQPSPAFAFGAVYQHTGYSPVQIPPPDQLTASLRTRLTGTLYLDASRSYFFDWQGQQWSPRFTLVVSAQ